MAKIWSQEEIDYLYENVGKVNLHTIAQNLQRPLNGVHIKMKRLKIGNTKEQLGLFTTGTLAQVLKVDRKTVEHWIDYHDLPFKKKKTCKTRSFYFIDPNQFWIWAFEHQERIDFSKVEVNAIPPEPEWVNTLRYQKREIKGNYYRSWTTKEEKALLELRSQGQTFKSIGKVLDRTPISVEIKHGRLMKSERNR
ncbi:DNA-binding protein [Schinkia azotoformans]|uniref:DNA-binding protein n=1 Tax=Schinkia azotoformans TaxID=1454 RepID=UPI002DB5A7B5|nr:DNA-binding protein [Schinkia azotoformans]MEC1759868.1 DNA-binding protein [Schinkia azotoformans]